MIGKILNSKIEAAGFRMKTFKMEHLKEISNDIKLLVEQGLLDEGFYKNNLSNFNYAANSPLSDAKSVIMIASPQHKSIAEFVHNGKSIEATIPPTYMYPKVKLEVNSILDSALKENGYSYESISLPLKLLAVRSGLGIYGRNNICYVPELGSFIRLSAFITNYDFGQDSWNEVKVMESCKNCKICINNCPTGAIDKERFLIHAQNCLTHYNEDDSPIPQWIRPNLHNAIVGCMKCQIDCPHNKKFTDFVDDKIFFNEKETELILGGTDFSSLPQETRSKITYIGMEPYYHILPRNIRLI